VPRREMLDAPYDRIEAEFRSLLSARDESSARMSTLALALIRVLQDHFSPLFAGSCRYTPGCADYMSESNHPLRRAARLDGWARSGCAGVIRLADTASIPSRLKSK
jgi:putative component of membrane protein insertase Oxa1/YidC/SpoIIIJ protein YidD